MERMIQDGRLPIYRADEMPCSRLGLGFEKLDRNVFDPNKAYDKVARIGIKKIRLQSGWMRTEQVKGVYDFAWLDEIVDKLLSLGLEPWLCLCYGNPLYTDFAAKVFGAVGCPPLGETAQAAWLRYVEATVAHFRGRITLYEIWNEPDCSYSWKQYFGQTKAEIDLVQVAREYGELARETAKVIHATDTDAKTCGFGLARISNLEFVNNALSTGLAKELDFVSFHIYSSTDNKRSDMIRSLRSIVEAHNPDIKLIQGESGAQSSSDGNGAMKGFAWTPEKQTKMLLRTMICDLHAGLEFTSYFSTMDMIEALRGRVDDKASYLDYGYFGVISAEFDENGRATGDYTEKPSYYALSALASLLGGTAHAETIPYAVDPQPSIRVNGNDFSGESLQIYDFRLHDGKTALCYWNGVDILTATYEGTVSLCVYGQNNDRIRLCDLRDGTLYRLPEGMVEDLTNGGIRLRNLPLTDSPLALIFG